jgi:hypothetical protein
MDEDQITTNNQEEEDNNLGAMDNREENLGREEDIDSDLSE